MVILNLTVELVGSEDFVAEAIELEPEGFPETVGVAVDILRLEVLLILVDIRVRSIVLAFLSAVDILEGVEEL